MRTTGEILEAIKAGEMPTHDECYWALQACESGWLMTQRKYHEQVFSPKREDLAKTLAENDFQTGKRCMEANPQTWLGPDRDYRKPENRKRRATSVKIYEAAMRGDLPNQRQK